MAKGNGVMGAVSRQGLVAALDVGTSKVVCLIARLDGARANDGSPLDGLRIVGTGMQVSQGIRQGTVVEMKQAETAIRGAVGQAEHEAGETIDRVVLGVSAGYPQTQRLEAVIDVAGQTIGDRDLRAVLDRARAQVQMSDREVVHAIPTSYTVDGSTGIEDPRGLCGEKLGVTMHFVTAAAGPLQNLATCAVRAQLELGGRVLTPYATALATLVEDERDLGSLCIDMGAGTTSFAVFSGGHMVSSAVIRTGGKHVTNDIAAGLGTSVNAAERLKTTMGSAIQSDADELKGIDVPDVADEKRGEIRRIPLARLNDVIKPRIEETFELVRDHLHASGAGGYAGRRVVLTGGASQLNGVAEAARRILEAHVVVRRPRRPAGFADDGRIIYYGAALGLLAYAANGTYDAMLTTVPFRRSKAGGHFGRIREWLRENF